jgi:fructose-1,6-bisphosphatase I
LVDILGKTGRENTFGEEVQKLDEFANQLLIDRLLASGQVYAVVSEEEKEPVYAKKEFAGDYIVYFDPLDGSSNIDTNCPIGTIFSIYHKDGGLLQKGEQQLAAGYAIYGSSVMFVYSVGDGVNGFTFDPAIGSFLLSHPQMKLSEHAYLYSINEGYGDMYDDGVRAYVQYLKETKKYKGRLVGSLIADAHRTFIKGGIFLYPGHEKAPDGKLRLMLEVNPFAFLTEQAGGIALGKDNKSPLAIEPKHIHDRFPFVMGSIKNIEEYLKFFSS